MDDFEKRERAFTQRIKIISQQLGAPMHMDHALVHVVDTLDAIMLGLRTVVDEPTLDQAIAMYSHVEAVRLQAVKEDADARRREEERNNPAPH